MTALSTLIEAVGVPMLRLHDLRHASATLMMANNVNPKIDSARLGQANIGITLGLYSHVPEGLQ
jgi:integrase